MSTPPDTFEEQLRQQLRTTAPAPYAGLDPSAVIGAGERVVRRRRFGTALVAAVVVAAVAVGASALTGGRPTAAPLPAAPSSTQPTSFEGQRTAQLTIARNGQPERTYSVSLTTTPAVPGQIAVEWTLDGAPATRAGGYDGTDRRAKWDAEPGSAFVFGIVPDESARSVTMAVRGAVGGNTSAVEPVRGTGWSAFVLAYDKPLADTDSVASVLWTDHLGRPVDQDGGVGSVTSIAGRSVWLTHDGAVLGVTDEEMTGSTPMPGTPDFGAFGDFPRVTTSTDKAGTAWSMTIRLRPEAVAATLVLADGRRVPVTPKPLGGWTVAVATPIAGAKAPELARVEWTTGAGVAHVDDAVG